MTPLDTHAYADVLVLDDEEPVRRSIVRQLERRGYTVLQASAIREAEAALAGNRVALLLCDITLAGESGMTLAGRMAGTYPDTAVVMVTGVDDATVADEALQAGAYGYIIKPFEHNELVISVAGALRRRTLEIESRDRRESLESLVAIRTMELRGSHEELRRSHEELVSRLITAAEYRDPETALHLERMARYSELLAELHGESTEFCERLRLAAPMHDIGKLGIPDDVLYKTGKFTDDDRRVMMAHPSIGYRILEGSASPLIQLAADIAYTHHEWFDGSGYPRGLRGSDIPLAGRIVAVADVFDALRTERRYKPALPFDETIATMSAERGRHFDPEVLDLLIDAADAVEAVRAGLGETTPAFTSA